VIEKSRFKMLRYQAKPRGNQISLNFQEDQEKMKREIKKTTRRRVRLINSQTKHNTIPERPFERLPLPLLTLTPLIAHRPHPHPGPTPFRSRQSSQPQLDLLPSHRR